MAKLAGAAFPLVTISAMAKLAQQMFSFRHLAKLAKMGDGTAAAKIAKRGSSVNSIVHSRNTKIH
jgi:hypothetical protein